MDRRRASLAAALAFLTVRAAEPEVAMLHRAFDTWAGVGLVAVGMQRQGWDLQLGAYGDGHWRATFYVTGMAHSIVGGSAWAPSPWAAVHRAAFDALARE